MWHFGFEICTYFFEGLGFSFRKLGLRKNVSVSVSKNLDSEKNLVSATLVSRKCQFWFQNFWSKNEAEWQEKDKNKSKEKGVIVCC